MACGFPEQNVLKGIPSAVYPTSNKQQRGMPDDVSQCAMTGAEETHQNTISSGLSPHRTPDIVSLLAQMHIGDILKRKRAEPSYRFGPPGPEACWLQGCAIHTKCKRFCSREYLASERLGRQHFC